MCKCTLSDTTLPLEERLSSLKGLALVTSTLALISFAVGLVAAATLLGIPVIGTLFVGTFVATIAVEILASALVVTMLLGLVHALSTLCLSTPKTDDGEDSWLTELPYGALRH